jgi:hypothetical protein
MLQAMHDELGLGRTSQGELTRHISIIVKNPPEPIHMASKLGLKIYRFGLRDPDFFVRKMIFLIFRVFMSNLNGLCDFYHDPNVWMNLPWSGDAGQ